MATASITPPPRIIHLARPVPSEALATANNGRFVTFDQSVAVSGVRKAQKDNLTVLR